MLKPIFDGVKAWLGGAGEGEEPGIPSLPAYTEDVDAIIRANYPYEAWLAAHQKWTLYAQSGLVSDEKALLEMMRETGRIQNMHQQALQPPGQPPQIPQPIPQYMKSGSRDMRPIDFAQPGGVFHLAPEEEVRHLSEAQRPPEIEFIQCAYCTQITPAYHDCSFCGAPTPVPPRQYMPEVTRYWKPTNWRVST